MLPIELYSSKTFCQDEIGNVFAPLYVEIPDASCLENYNLSFLKKVVAPKDYYYLYLVINKLDEVVKVGQSSRPLKRLIEHVYNFRTYGNVPTEEIKCIFSRNAFASNCDKERELLNAFRTSFPTSPQIGSEFFANAKPSEASAFMIKFLSDNQKYQYK